MTDNVESLPGKRNRSCPECGKWLFDDAMAVRGHHPYCSVLSTLEALIERLDGTIAVLHHLKRNGMGAGKWRWPPFEETEA